MKKELFFLVAMFSLTLFSCSTSQKFSLVNACPALIEVAKEHKTGPGGNCHYSGPTGPNVVPERMNTGSYSNKKSTKKKNPANGPTVSYAEN